MAANAPRVGAPALVHAGVWCPSMPDDETQQRQQQRQQQQQQHPSPAEWWEREDHMGAMGEATPGVDLFLRPGDAVGSSDRDEFFYAPDESRTSDWRSEDSATEEWVGQPIEEHDVRAAAADNTLVPGGIDASAAWLPLQENLADLPAPEPLPPDDWCRTATENVAPPSAGPVVVVAVAHAPPALGPAAGGPAERKAKEKNHGGCCPLCSEQHDRLSRFWRKFGYDGPPYCLRCAELFRSHQLTCSIKSETCSREQPCPRCANVFVHFTKDKEACFAAMDQAQPLSRGRAAYVRPGGDGASACPLCRRTDHGGLGVFWKTFGYAGPPYCTACSTSFRNHIIRRRGGIRTGCSRESPCLDCERVLSHFGNREMALERMGSGAAAAAAAVGQAKASRAQEDAAAASAAPPPAPTDPPPAPLGQPLPRERHEGQLLQGNRVMLKPKIGPLEVQDLNPMTRLLVADEQQQDKKRQRRHERVGAIKSLGAIVVVALGLLMLNGGVSSMFGGGGGPSPQPAAEDGKEEAVPANGGTSNLIPLCDVGGGDTGSTVLHPSSSSSMGLSSSRLSAIHVEEPDSGGRFGLCRVRSMKQLKLGVDADSLTCVLFTVPWCSDCDIYASRLLPIPLQTDVYYDNNISFVEVSINGARDTDQLVKMGLLTDSSTHDDAAEQDAEHKTLDGDMFPSVRSCYIVHTCSLRSPSCLVSGGTTI